MDISPLIQNKISDPPIGVIASSSLIEALPPDLPQALTQINNSRIQCIGHSSRDKDISYLVWGTLLLPPHYFDVPLPSITSTIAEYTNQLVNARLYPSQGPSRLSTSSSPSPVDNLPNPTVNTPPNLTPIEWKAIPVTYPISQSIIDNTPFSLSDIDQHLNLLPYIKGKQYSFSSIKQDKQFFYHYLTPLYQLHCAIEEGVSASLDTQPFLIPFLGRALYVLYRYSERIRTSSGGNVSLVPDITQALSLLKSNDFHATIRNTLVIIKQWDIVSSKDTHFSVFASKLIRSCINHVLDTDILGFDLQNQALVEAFKAYITNKDIKTLERCTSRKRKVSSLVEKEEPPAKRLAQNILQ